MTGSVSVTHRKSCLALLNMGAEVDNRDNNYRTPLMWAAKTNQLKCVEILLDFKAFTDLQNVADDTALNVACAQGHAAIVNLLLDHGAIPMLQNKQEFSCLEVAAKAGSSDVAMAIVKHKRFVITVKSSLHANCNEEELNSFQPRVITFVTHYSNLVLLVFSLCVNFWPV